MPSKRKRRDPSPSPQSSPVLPVEEASSLPSPSPPKRAKHKGGRSDEASRCCFHLPPFPPHPCGSNAPSLAFTRPLLAPKQADNHSLFPLSSGLRSGNSISAQSHLRRSPRLGQLKDSMLPPSISSASVSTVKTPALTTADNRSNLIARLAAIDDAARSPASEPVKFVLQKVLGCENLSFKEAYTEYITLMNEVNAQRSEIDSSREPLNIITIGQLRKKLQQVKQTGGEGDVYNFEVLTSKKGRPPAVPLAVVAEVAKKAVNRHGRNNIFAYNLPHVLKAARKRYSCLKSLPISAFTEANWRTIKKMLNSLGVGSFFYDFSLPTSACFTVSMLFVYRRNQDGQAAIRSTVAC